MTRRSKQRFPELDPEYNTRLRKELVDYDYLDKLNDSEKEFLNKFTREFISGYFEKTEKGNYKKTNLHKKKEERRECYNRNNARNRCIFGLSKSVGKLIYTTGPQIASLIESLQLPSTNEVENEMIEYLNSKAEHSENQIGSSEEESNSTTDLNNKSSN